LYSLGITRSRLRLGVLQLATHLIESRVIYFGRHLRKTSERFLYLVLYESCSLSEVDRSSPSRPRVEVSTIAKGGTDRGYGYFKDYTTRVLYLVLADQFCSSLDYSIDEIVSSNMKSPNRSIVGYGLPDITLPQLKDERSWATSSQGFLRSEGHLPFLR